MRKHILAATAGLALAAAMASASANTQQWYAAHPADAKSRLQQCREKMKAHTLTSETERAECQRASNAQQFEVYVPTGRHFSSAGGSH